MEQTAHSLTAYDLSKLPGAKHIPPKFPYAIIKQIEGTTQWLQIIMDQSALDMKLSENNQSIITASDRRELFANIGGPTSLGFLNAVEGALNEGKYTSVADAVEGILLAMHGTTSKKEDSETSSEGQPENL